jgi:hypothetical protein
METLEHITKIPVLLLREDQDTIKVVDGEILN